jgi:TRAP-type mannitol/chloroaromatic compound transport system permease large subunit
MSIGVTAIILFAVFALLLFASCPISVSIVISSIVAAISSLSWDQITFITMQKMNSGVESFSLLAIPLFILAGNIMNNGGIARRLVNFAKLFVGSGQYCGKHAFRRSVRFLCCRSFRYGRLHLPYPEGRGL